MMRTIATALVSVAALQGLAAVENTSFEEGLAGWRPAANVSIDDAVAHTGARSVRIIVKDPKTENVYVMRTVPVMGGARYRAACFVRTEDVKAAEGRDTSVGAGMIIEWADARGTYIGWGASTYNNFGTRDWFKIESGLLRPPPTAARAMVLLCLRGTGTAWFDDFSFEKMEESVPKCRPVNDAVVTNNTPEFAWRGCVGVTNYVLRLSKDASFPEGAVISCDAGGFERFQLERPLAPGVWYWKVEAAGMEDRDAWRFRQMAPEGHDCLPPLVKGQAARVTSRNAPFSVTVKDVGRKRPEVRFLGRKARFVRDGGGGLLEYEFRAPENGWPAGLTAGDVTAVDAAGNRKETPFFLLNSESPVNPVSVGAGGRYQENGKTIFPLGIYEVEAKYLKEVRAAGFEVVHLYRWERDRDDEACSEYLDACRAAGLRAFVGFDRRAIMEGDCRHVAQRVAALASHPALFCWYLYDEPEITRQFVAPDRLAAMADFVRRLDAYHPVVVSTWGNAGYRRTWDSHWTQAYGNPSEALKELDRQRSRLADSPITLLVNCNDDRLALARRNGTLPDGAVFGRDLDHLRACAFLGVVKGCNGIFWWWFAKDSKWYYSAAQCPAAWRDLSQVVHEIAELRPIIVSDGPVATGECGAPAARVLWWSKDIHGRRTTIVVNTSDRPVSTTPILGHGSISLGRHEVRVLP